MSGNEALGKTTTVEQEMAKFQGFAVKDGETFDGNSKSAADERAEAEAAERHAQTVNARSHQVNQEDGTTGTKAATGKAASEAPKVELTEEEEQNALQDATDKKGAILTDEEADAIVEKALAAKEKAAAKPQPDPDKAKKAFERREARRRDNLARENEDLRRRLEALERGGKSAPLTTDSQGDKKASQDGKPDHTDTTKYPYGNLDENYIADLAEWKTLRAIEAREASKQTQQKSQQDAAAVAELKEKLEAFEEAGSEVYDDFYEVVMGNLANEANPDGWPCSDALGELILESDHGTKIAYELASDIKEARKIFQLSPARQAAWFGKKEAELSAGSAKRTDNQDAKDPPAAEAAKKRVLPQPRNGQVRESKAPAPPSKLGGTSGNRVPTEATPDFAAFEAMAMGAKK